MKLVDILARELNQWPDALGHAAGQAADGTLHSEMEPEDAETVRTIESYTICSNWIIDIVTRAEWLAAVDALNADKCEHSYSNNIGCPECGELSAPKVVEWDGEGEPPVGIECEWRPNVHGWVKVKILGRDGSDTWYRASGEEHSQTCRNMAFFRPIRTAEQVAAEEREKAIKEMMMNGVDAGDSTIEYSCAALYDAGYRKEPKPCGS